MRKSFLNRYPWGKFDELQARVGGEGFHCTNVLYTVLPYLEAMSPGLFNGGMKVFNIALTITGTTYLLWSTTFSRCKGQFIDTKERGYFLQRKSLWSLDCCFRVCRHNVL